VVEGAPGTSFDAAVVVRRRLHVAPDGAFAALECDRDGDELVIVGPVAHLSERERAHVTGRWMEHPRFGLQVRADGAEPLAPGDATGIATYLRRVRHVGPERARRLQERHGEATLEAIDADPRGALGASGLKGLRLEQAVASWNGLRATRALHLALAPHGLAWLVGRIHKTYGERSLSIVLERPYELTRVFGVGFPTADRIAHGSGIAGDDPRRLAAAVLHVLAEAERDGSTCLPASELVAGVARLLDGLAPGGGLLGAMVTAGDLAVEEDADGTWWARPATRGLERELARRVRALLAGEPLLEAPEAPPRRARFAPAPEQWAAVRNAFAHRLSIITGGPGTGKTATIQLICAVAAEREATVRLVSPTGRAARRMAEATGRDASTIHAALGWVPGQGPTHDEADPLDGDLLIVDETSMANLELLMTLLRAVGERTQVVLVGDADQLAPVGAGKPFAELTDSGAVPTTRLAHIFRQAAGSMIVRGAHAVRGGAPPSFAVQDGLRRDLFMIERPDPAAALEEIVGLVARRLPAHYEVDPVADVQVFAPVYRGPVGIDALNEALRAALNPDGERVLGGRLRLGDKLMLSGRNLHELGLMNGTVMRLLDFDEERGLLTVDADGATVRLPEDEAPRLALAYACSVHKGQGIELPVAIVVAHPAAGAHFLRREMLYTAMTRARKATIVVGQAAVVARAARTPDTARRHSRLVKRLAG
jgi:exodeoxyribonuclease V alpha subunit